MENSTKTTAEAINNINNNLDVVFPEMTPEEEFFYLDHLDERMRRAMEDPDYQEQVMIMVQNY
jgi:hypothetical protein